MDEALETGILALLHRHAGRLNGDDGTPEAWMESEGQILGSVGWAGSTQVPGPAWALSPFPTPGIRHTHDRKTLHWAGL